MEEHRTQQELEYTAAKEAAKEEKEPFVERPKYQRVLAWILCVLVLIGLAFYYFWIFKGGRL